MKRKPLRTQCTTPFALWTDLARTTRETLFASAYVIGHRTGRMAIAGPQPNTRDRREFALMGQEKIDAAIASAAAMTAQLTRANLRLGAQFFEQTVGVTSAIVALGSSTSPGQALARHAALARSLTQSAQSTAHLLHTTARVAQHGLKPIHARATANSRRLRKL